MLVAVLGIVMTAGVLWYIFQVCAGWMIFTKAGQPGWAAFIPIYRSYIRYRLSWSKSYLYWVSLAASVAGWMLRSQTGPAHLLCWAALAASAVIRILSNVKLARAFGQNTLFAVGLILLNPVFIFILGFGQSKYEGVQE